MHFRTFPIVAVFAAAACGGSSERRPSLVTVDTLPGGLLAVQSSGPAWRDSSEAWRLVEEVRYGGAEGTPGELVQPQSFAADETGRLYVVDRKPSVIKVFNPDGSFLRTMGREGRGPGEFGAGFIATRANRIALHDPGEGRTSVFDTTGTFLKSGVTFCCYWGDISIDTAMRIVLPAFITSKEGRGPQGVPYARYTMDVAPVDTFFLPHRQKEEKVWTFRAADRGGRNGAMMTMLVPWTPAMQHGLHPWGGVVRGYSDEFKVVRVPDATDSTWIASIAWQPGTIPDALREAKVAEAVKNASQSVGEGIAKQTARLDDVPTTAPAFTRLSVDEDGYIWARQLLGSDSTQTTFTVLDPKGAWLGTLHLPFGVQDYGGVAFGKGALYVNVEDEDGRPVIIRLRVVPRQARPG